MEFKNFDDKFKTQMMKSITERLQQGLGGQELPIKFPSNLPKQSANVKKIEKNTKNFNKELVDIKLSLEAINQKLDIVLETIEKKKEKNIVSWIKKWFNKIFR